MKHRAFALSAGVIFLLCAQLRAAEFDPLGGYTNSGEISSANALSADGSTVVGATTVPAIGAGAQAHLEGFRWTRLAGMMLLRANSTTSFSNSDATGVSSDGRAVVGTEDSADHNSAEAFRWDPNGGMAELGFLAPPPLGSANQSSASIVSPDGEAVFGSSNDSAGDLAPFRWTQKSGMEQFATQVNGVSADGGVLLGERVVHSPEGLEADLWTEQAGVIGLGQLAGAPFDFSAARAASADGSVIVGEARASSNLNVPFRWTAQTGLASLGALPNAIGGGANVISADGTVVLGEFEMPFGHSTAFVWDEVHGLRDLASVLTRDSGLASQMAGWEFSTVAGLSQDGLSLAGNGIDPQGNFEAWFVHLDHPLTAPEPSSLAMALLAPAPLFILVRRKRISAH